MKRAVPLVLAVLALPVFAAPAAAQQSGECAPPEPTAVRQQGWAQSRLAPSRVWTTTRGAVDVALVDTGVSATAPSLAGAVTPGSDLVGGPGDVDCAGHGTFVAGLLAARPADGGPFAGIAPDARIIPFRVTSDPTRVDPVRLADGVRAAVDSGARIVVVGLVNTVDTPELRAAVATAAERDVLVIAPAAVRQAKQKAFPASLAGVLAVAPVGPDGPPAQVTLGATPVLAAPAEQLLGIGPSGPGHRTASGAELGVGYVAGAAALVRDRYPDLRVPEVIARLTATADKPAGPSPHPVVGHGVVDPVAAVTALMPGRSTAPAAPPERLAVPVPPVEDTGPTRIAVAFLGALVGGAALVAVVALAVARGRRRGWRAG